MKKILITNVCHIGDVIASLPLAHVIKQHWPACQITFLCAQYTSDVCTLALDIDEVIIWDDLQKLTISNAGKQIKKLKFDAVFHTFAGLDVYKIMYKAGIKIRVDEGRRFYKRLYSNKRIRSFKYSPDHHQAQLILTLLKTIKLPYKYEFKKLSTMIRLKKPTLSPNIKQHLSKKKFNLVLHPFSNKSGREWPLEYFFQLTKSLDLSKYHIIITGSAAEGDRLQNTPLSDPKYVTNLCGKTNLTELFALLAHIDGIVVSGTGPLHIAAALGTRCLGLFPKIREQGIVRWQALGPRATSIATDKPCTGSCSNTDCACMRALTPQMVQGYIEGWYLAWQHEKDNTQIAQELHT